MFEHRRVLLVLLTLLFIRSSSLKPKPHLGVQPAIADTFYIFFVSNLDILNKTSDYKNKQKYPHTSSTPLSQ